MVVTKGWRGGEGKKELLFYGYTVSDLQDEKIL